MEKLGGIAAYLNQATLNANKLAITEIDIDKIRPNEQNFYGLRDIEQLAAMISQSGFISPLEVVEDGEEYRLIAGHRRRAAVLLLIESGERESREVPCIIRDFKSDEIFSQGELETLNIIVSNQGQRKVITPIEKLEEINRLKPLAKKFYDNIRAEKKGKFRNFFANEILKISDSELQRLESLKNLSPRALKALTDGVLNKTVASRLAGLSAEEQDKFLDTFQDQDYTGKLLDEFKASLGTENTYKNPDNEDENEEYDELICKEENDDENTENCECSIDDNNSPVCNEDFSVNDEKTVTCESDGALKNKSEKIMSAIAAADEFDSYANNYVIESISRQIEDCETHIMEAKANENAVDQAKWAAIKSKFELIVALVNE